MQQSSGRKEESWGAEGEEGWRLAGAAAGSTALCGRSRSPGANCQRLRRGERSTSSKDWHFKPLWQWLEAVSSPVGMSAAHRLSHNPCPEELPEAAWEPARRSGSQRVQEPAPGAVLGAARSASESAEESGKELRPGNKGTSNSSDFAQGAPRTVFY